MKLILKSLLAILVASAALVQTEAQTDNRVITLDKSIHGVGDKYFGSYYDKGGVGNGLTLVTGGWGDVYAFLVKWNALKLPKVASKVWLGLDRTDYNTNTTDMFYYAMATPWHENDGVAMFTNGFRVYRYRSSPNSPELVDLSASVGVGDNTTYLDITDMYKAVLSNSSINQGVLVMPKRVDNRFDFFYSSESPRPPKLILTVPPPTLKLPLPGGKKWYLTVEAGGKYFDGGMDYYHMNDAYYALDFDDSYEDSNGKATPWTNTPVFAAESGIITKCEYKATAGGNLIKIDHDGDGDENTGYQTLYYHLKNLDKGNYSISPPFKVGTWVNRGTCLGYIGNTGLTVKAGDLTTLTHLHFEVRFRNKGNQSFLDGLLLESTLIKDYKVGTRAKPKFYPSTNTK